MTKVNLWEITPEDLSDLIVKSILENADLLSVNYIPKEEKEFLTRKETADYFKVSLVCIHDWINKGILKPYKVGNRTYFMHSELRDVLLDSNKAS